MLLNYFISEFESQSIPLPDRIVANGSYTARVLAHSGYGSDRVVLGGGLRQSYLQPILYRENGALVVRKIWASTGRALIDGGVSKAEDIAGATRDLFGRISPWRVKEEDSIAHP